MGSESERLARRFLHVCLNIRDLARSTAFYGDALGLRLAMQTDDELDGAVLGYSGMIRSQASFIYDWRGPRSSSALELVRWTDPPTAGEPYEDVSTPGLHAIAVGVPSLEHAESQLTQAAGVVISRRGRSSFGGADSPAMLFRDPDGATVEVVEGDFAATTILGIRATCSNVDTSATFYQTVGFGVVDESATGDFVWGPGRVVTLSLPEDEGGFALCLAQPRGVKVNGPTYANGHHCGFTRMALRVDDAQDTHHLLTGKGLALKGPFALDLPGTAVQGLHIGTVDDPDGILVEFVDRPKSFFRPPPAPPTKRSTVGSVER